VSALLDDSRTDPNAVDKEGNTPLALASNLRKVQIRLLHHSKLDPNQPISNGGELQISVGIRLCEWEAFQGWEERGIKLASGPVDNEGNTTLHLLIEKHAPRDLIENTIDKIT